MIEELRGAVDDEVGALRKRLEEAREEAAALRGHGGANPAFLRERDVLREQVASLENELSLLTRARDADPRHENARAGWEEEIRALEEAPAQEGSGERAPSGGARVGAGRAGASGRAPRAAHTRRGRLEAPRPSRPRAGGARGPPRAHPRAHGAPRARDVHTPVRALSRGRSRGPESARSSPSCPLSGGLRGRPPPRRVDRQDVSRGHLDPRWWVCPRNLHGAGRAWPAEAWPPGGEVRWIVESTCGDAPPCAEPASPFPRTRR
jgi:hypothetical protein